jgi:hypothetical protein
MTNTQVIRRRSTSPSFAAFVIGTSRSIRRCGRERLPFSGAPDRRREFTGSAHHHRMVETAHDQEEKKTRKMDSGRASRALETLVAEPPPSRCLFSRMQSHRARAGRARDTRDALRNAG